MSYKLFYTNYTVDAVVQIKSLDVSVEGYYLSTQQLEELAGEDKQLTVQDRIKWDLQSLGLVALHMGSLGCKDRYYTFGKDDRVVLSDEVLMKRLKELRKNYSKKVVRLVEALLDGKQGSFDDIIEKDDRSRMRSSRVSSEDRS
jgi:restriction endonuclease Mrr